MTTPELVTSAPVIVETNDRRRLAEEVALGYLARFRGVTRTNYQLGLRQWFEFCEQHRIGVLEARRAHVDLYMRHMEEVKGYARSTVCGKSNPIVGFYGYAVEEGYLPVSPAQFVKRPWAERVSTTNGLTRQELHAILDLGQASNPVDHAVVCLLGLNGLRVGELCAIQVEHLGQDKWHPTLWLGNRKGGRAQRVPLANRTAYAVNQVVGDRTEGQLFTTGRGNPMTRFQAGRIVKRLAKRGGGLEADQPALVPARLRHPEPERRRVDARRDDLRRSRRRAHGRVLRPGQGAVVAEHDARVERVRGRS